MLPQTGQATGRSSQVNDMRLLPVFSRLLIVLAICCHYPVKAQTVEATHSQIEKLIDAGRLREAEEQLKATRKASSETPATLFIEARLRFKQRRFIESIQKLERVIAATNDPSLRQLDAEAHKLMGLNLVLLDRLDLAEPFLKDAAAMLPDDHLARFHLGMLYYTTSRFAAAETELRIAIKLDPAFAPAHDKLGLALEELGQTTAALAAYRQAIALSERQRLKDPSPYLNLGKFLLAQNRYAESLTLLQKAAELDGQSAEAAFQLGKALGKLGREAEAIKALNQAIRNDPAYAEPHYLLSRIYLNQGREEEARREMEVFQRLPQRKKP
jgi:tetratricopeptide (TPR) repeat protein